MNDNFSIPAVFFPDQLETDEIKKSKDWGIQVGHAIQNEWFRKTSVDGSRFYTNRDFFHKLRMYAKGEQSVQKYKKEMSLSGDISYLNLDWTPVPIVPKFVDIVVNGMSNRLFEVKANAIDATSSSKKKKYKQDLEKAMIGKPIIDIAKTAGYNISPVPEEEIPESFEELNLKMQFYKDEIEVAQEKAIENVLKLNRYDLIKKRLDEDATVVGVSACKHYFDKHNGIKVEYCDPANMIWSPTESPQFEDCYYFGEVKNVNITELKKINPDLSQEDIKEISKMAAKWDAYQNIRGGNINGNIKNNTATLLYFCFKTDLNVVYKNKKTRNGGEKIIKRDDSFQGPKSSDANFEKISKRIDVWFEGVLVLGTNHLLKWEVMKNMVRPKSAISKVYPPYVMCAPRMYRGRIDSLVKRMIPIADQIQLTHLKIQQVIAGMKPDGVFLDVDGLNAINLGNGNSYTPEDALNLYFQTGSVIGRSYTEDGEFNNARVPIQELTSSGANAKISSLLNMYNHHLNMMRDVTGLNEARDGSKPDQFALVGLQKLAALNSNTATKHVLESGLFIAERLSECLCYRMADVLEFSDMKETFANMIGQNSIDILDQILDLPFYDFGIYIEMTPDEEEQQVLEQNIQTAISAGKIDIDDAIDIRSVKNIKVAAELLKFKKKKKEEKDAERNKQNYEAQAQAQASLAQSQSQSKAQIIQLQGQMDAQMAQMEHQMAMEKMEREFQFKTQLINLQGQINFGVAGKTVEAKTEIEKMKEDRKDGRTKIQATQQSKMIKQRSQDLDPIDFNEEDSLGGLDDLFSID